MTETSTEACKGPVGAQGFVPSARSADASLWDAPRGTTWEPRRELQTEARQPGGPLATHSIELEAPPTERQLKRRQNKDSKLAKKFDSLDAEINNLKSQMEALEDKITKASQSTNTRFKRKKIRSMKREADKIAERLRESEKALKLLGPIVPRDQTLE